MRTNYLICNMRARRAKIVSWYTGGKWTAAICTCYLLLMSHYVNLPDCNLFIYGQCITPTKSLTFRNYQITFKIFVTRISIIELCYWHLATSKNTTIFAWYTIPPLEYFPFPHEPRGWIITALFGFFDFAERCAQLKAAGNPLDQLIEVIDFEAFRPTLELVRDKERKISSGRKPYDVVLMFKILILGSFYNLSDDQLEYQIRDRISFMQFLGFTLSDRSPDAKTIWLFRNDLAQLELVAPLFEQFDHDLEEAGFAARPSSIFLMLMVMKIIFSTRDIATIRCRPRRWRWIESGLVFGHGLSMCSADNRSVWAELGCDVSGLWERVVRSACETWCIIWIGMWSW